MRRCEGQLSWLPWDAVSESVGPMMFEVSAGLPEAEEHRCCCFLSFFPIRLHARFAYISVIEIQTVD